MGLRGQELTVHVEIDLAHGLVGRSIEYGLPVPVQAGHCGSRRQLGQVVPHHPTIDAGHDNPDPVVMEPLGVFSRVRFGSLSTSRAVVGVSGPGQRLVHRGPTAGGGVLPTEIAGQLLRRVSADTLHKRAQPRLGGVVADAHADRHGQHDDEDHRCHDSPANGHYFPSATTRPRRRTGSRRRKRSGWAAGHPG